MAKTKTKRFRIIIPLVLVAVLVLAAIFYVYKSSSKKTGVDSGEFLPKANNETNSSINNSENNTNEKSETSEETKSITPVLTLTKPINGSVVSMNRTISGSAYQVGTQISYVLSGEQAGELASGVINLSDNTSKKVNFSTQFTFIRKPIEGDIGSMIFYLGSGSTKKEIKQVEVSF